ncbi:MAG: AraC family transcriptional regulator [Clostridiales bacterium]|nr:AraC family transcriptional regulator [Clostridiales bacterium]
MNDIAGTYEKTGYLNKHYKFFHLKDSDNREFDYHYHDFDKIIYFMGGKADYMIEGKKFLLEPYDFIFVNRNEIHKPMVDFSAPYERMILYIDHGFIEKYTDDAYDLTECFKRTFKEKTNIVRFPAVVTRQLYETLRRMEENDNDNAYAGELYGEILFLEFMVQMNRACLENEFAYHQTAKYNKKIIDIIQFINENLSEELSIDSLSEKFYMSKYHMMRQFKEETGYSIHQYTLEKRILAAKSMLLNGIPATVAAMECGFKDYSTFARAFKKKSGSIPSKIK